MEATPHPIAGGAQSPVIQHQSKARELGGPCVQPRLQGFRDKPNESIPRLTIASAEVPRQHP
jgi:hypothetical protein